MSYWELSEFKMSRLAYNLLVHWMYSYNIGIAIAYTVIRKCIFRLSKNPSETNNDKISKIVIVQTNCDKMSKIVI